MDDDDLPQDVAEAMLDEIKLQMRLRHKNLLQITVIYTSPEKCVFASPLAKGDLMSFLEQAAESESGEAAFTCAQVRNISEQLLEGLVFLHSIMICHRDIKLDNILMFDDVCND